MTALRKPTLDWIDVDQVVAIAINRFRKSAEKVQNDSTSSARVEPTLAIVRAGLTGTSLLESDTLDLSVSLTKTIQNAVGLFHQDVLGSLPGWSSTGTAGGVVDLKGTSPVTGKQVLAEVKMRFNTIKASDEKNVWDSLKDAVALTGNDAVGYIFQIIPKDLTPYDRPWSVSGRPQHESVRCADGVTAYHLVTGKPTALFELLEAMPYVVAQVAENTLGSSTEAALAFERIEEEYERIISDSLPKSSALTR